MKNNSSNILLIGMGEIGSSIKKLYDSYSEYKVYYLDVKIENEQNIPKSIEVMHINIPYSEKFIEIVSDYIEKYNPNLTIINSTVKIGTTKQIRKFTNKKVIHSPVMGVHPYLTESMRTFIKIIGGETLKESLLASEHFESIGVKSLIYRTSSDSEAAKLLDTTYYMYNIFFNKKVWKLCKENNLNFDDVYTTTNEIYNDGYEKMGMKHVCRPILKYIKGRILGHCLEPNALLLEDKFPLCKLLLSWNEEEKNVT